MTSPSKLLSLDDLTLTGGKDGAAAPLATWLNLQATLLGSQ